MKSALLRFAEPRFNHHHHGTVDRGLRSAHADTVIALLAGLEAKDSYTHQHSLNVSVIAERLARILGLDAAQTDVIFTAALLHDVGKIGISDLILTKPGRLDAVEFDAMKKHSEIGARMLSPIARLQRERTLVLHHHEWFNGGGYPSGLKGNDIPFGARILQVADSIDAILSPRHYKPASTIQHAVSELNAGRGRQFDPQVAQSAVSWLLACPEQVPSLQPVA